MDNASIHHSLDSHRRQEWLVLHKVCAAVPAALQP